jgi:hypothetical protein
MNPPKRTSIRKDVFDDFPRPGVRAVALFRANDPNLPGHRTRNGQCVFEQTVA